MKTTEQEQVLVDTLKKYAGNHPVELIANLMDVANSIQDTEIADVFKKMSDLASEDLDNLDIKASIFTGFLTGYIVHQHIEKKELEHGVLDSPVPYAEEFFGSKTKSVTQQAMMYAKVTKQLEKDKITRVFQFISDTFGKYAEIYGATNANIHYIGSCIGYKLFEEARVTKLNKIFRMDSYEQK